jgi:BMFP domain-containing protein YqiC
VAKWNTPDIEARDRFRLLGHRLEQLDAKIRLELGRLATTAANVETHLGQTQPAALQRLRHVSRQPFLVHPIDLRWTRAICRGARKA